MILGSDFPVYHTAFDSYDWMTNFGDPLFHRHVAGYLFLFLHIIFMLQFLSIKVSVKFLIDVMNITFTVKSSIFWFSQLLEYGDL